MSRKAAVLLTSLALHAIGGCKGAPSGRAWSGRPPPTNPGGISGTVLERSWLRPLAGRIVVAGGRWTTTDLEGRFVLDGVGPVYDVGVLDPDRSVLTLYEGVSRRDPVLVHEPSPQGSGRQNDQQALVGGTLSGGSF